MDWRGYLVRLVVAVVLVALWWVIWELIRCRRYRRGSPANRRRRESNKPCVTVPGRVHRRPDPLIYSQKYLLSQGLAVTWDNPDIHLELGGVPISSHSLQPDTVYDIIARIWNGSTSAPAVNMPVKFSFLTFGIGTAKVPIGETRVDLPVKGATGHPAFTRIPWRTPATPGHYCIQAELIWTDDANPNNNLGQENTDVQPLNPPHATFTFPVRNDSQRPRVLALEADTYVIPVPLPCEGQDPGTQSNLTRAEIAARGEVALRRHGRYLFPVPQDWRVLIEPRELRLAPGEERLVTVDVTAPDNFSGGQGFNVNAFEGDLLVGGVSLYVQG